MLYRLQNSLSLPGSGLSSGIFSSGPGIPRFEMYPQCNFFCGILMTSVLEETKVTSYRLMGTVQASPSEVKSCG